MRKNNSFCIPPLVRFYVWALLSLTIYIVADLIEKTTVSLIVLALGIIPFIIYYKM